MNILSLFIADGQHVFGFFVKFKYIIGREFLSTSLLIINYSLFIVNY